MRAVSYASLFALQAAMVLGGFAVLDDSGTPAAPPGTVAPVDVSDVESALDAVRARIAEAGAR